jgi:hypothetical protein
MVVPDKKFCKIRSLYMIVTMKRMMPTVSPEVSLIFCPHEAIKMQPLFFSVKYK